jgi:AraC-like DNA-binding protein
MSVTADRWAQQRPSLFKGEQTGVTFRLSPVPAIRNARYYDCNGGIFEGVKTNGKTAFPRRVDKVAGPNGTDTAKLARLIAAYAPHDGNFELRIPGVRAIRYSRVNKECVHALGLPSLCIAAQGAKTVIVGEEVYEYDASRMIVFSVALPVAAQITQASFAEPYLALKLDLDPLKISELVLRVYPNGLPPVQERRAVYVAPVDVSIVNAATRLVECLAQPGDVELLAPLVVDEILIRLLRSRIGVRVAQMGFAESSVYRLAKAISWLRANFSQPMKVEELAELVHMSVSSFHEHFKAITSMSPLHYQKVLRLQEARRLMLSTMMDAGTASQRVGYLSASQFSREYSRFFGSAPTRDIARLRQDTRLWSDPVRTVD